jgi:hypothetical protein
MFLKNERIRWIAVFVAIALLFVGMTISLCFSIGNKTSSEKTDEVADNGESGLEVTVVEECGVQLLASSGETRGTGSSFEKRLTATVIPYDAPNKEVDWSAAWAPGSTRANQNVSEYLTVTPNEDGSPIAFVRCLKSFEGDNIIVTVTTRVGGFHATCQVEYKGIPESLTIDTTGKTIRHDSAWGVDMVELTCGDTYPLNLVLDNELHAVGSTYGQFTVSVESHGSIQTDDRNHSNTTHEDTYSVGTATILDVNDSLEVNGSVYCCFDVGGGFMILIDLSIENGKLMVDARTPIASYYSIRGDRPGYLERHFREYTDGKVPYFTVTVTDTVSGLSDTINVKTMPTVTRVTMSPDEMTF